MSIMLRRQTDFRAEYWWRIREGRKTAFFEYAKTSPVDGRDSDEAHFHKLVPYYRRYKRGLFLGLGALILKDLFAALSLSSSASRSTT